MTENEISYHIRGAIYAVYNELGPGLLESIYEAALIAELEEKGLKIECQKKVDVYYHGKKLPVDYRIDILVDDKVVIELKSVQDMREVYKIKKKNIPCMNCLGFFVVCLWHVFHLEACLDFSM